jgi:ER-bound oxygenase mpaB/B'/Rubber oxygenase, catalytic domain
MVLDAMNDMTPISGAGFRSVLRVRMLHSQVRLRLLRSPNYDTQAHGVPINQEDLLATLGAFSVACIWTMERMGIYISPDDREANILAWRYIGYYLGIDAALLRRFYSDYHTAEMHLCSSITHLLEPRFGEPSGMLPLRLLNGISNRPLYGHSIQYHAELSRLLIGDELADIFQLPRGNLRTRVGLWGTVTMMRLELWFGRWYRAGWERERIRLMKEFVDWLVMWQVGKRQGFERTTFGYKVEVKDRIRAPLANGTVETEEMSEDGNVKVQIDRSYIKALKRKYYRVIIIEPVLLVGGLLCGFGYTIWYVTRM